MMSHSKSAMAESQRGAWLSIVSYVVLSGLKLGVGWWAGSRALTADGVNNVTDIIGSVAVLFGLRIAIRPADADHRYGHQRAETVAAIVVASIMGLVGLNVLVSAAQALFRAELAVPHFASVWVGLASALAMTAVYLYNIRLARRTGSKALAAAAYDNRSDALTSLGVVAGIVGAHLGWRWTDPVAGILVALIIVRTAWHIGAEAANALMDGFDAKRLATLRAQVAGVDGVVQVRDIRGREQGDVVAVDVTVTVSPQLAVAEAHAISERIERTLRADKTVEFVHVHVEPAEQPKAGPASE